MGIYDTQKGYDQWETVLDLIIMDNDDNKRIDSNQGKLFVPLILPNPSSSEDENDGDIRDTQEGGVGTTIDDGNNGRQCQ
jgi:hypothetical protein